MSKSQEQLDEELMMSIRDTVDDMFTRMFPPKMFCEAEVTDAELIEDEDEDEDEDNND